MKKRAYFILFFSVIFYSSCFVNKNNVYFKTLTKDTTIKSYVYSSEEIKIQKKDLIGITISSLSSGMDEIFNGSSKISTGISGTNISSNYNPGFLVDESGNIKIHYLGSIKIEGLTLKELKQKLEKDLVPFFKEPIISVQFLNKKVTLMGEFNNPHVLNLTEDKISLTDAIVTSGELKNFANAKDILIIRDSGNSKIVKHISLEDHSIFSSQWFYLVLLESVWYFVLRKAPMLIQMVECYTSV